MKVTSLARTWVAPLYALFVVLLGVFLIWYMWNAAFTVVAIVAMAAGAFLSPRIPWGYELEGAKMTVTRPYHRKDDVIFDLSEVAETRYTSINFVKQVWVKLADGHAFTVTGMGTQKLGPFADAVVRAAEANRAAAAPQPETAG